MFNQQRLDSEPSLGVLSNHEFYPNLVVLTKDFLQTVPNIKLNPGHPRSLRNERVA